MEITIRATEFEPDERLKARAEQKVAKLQKYLPKLERAVIELSEEPTRGVEARHSVRVNLIMFGKVLLRAEAKAADPYIAVDAAVDNLKRQLLRYKEMRDDWHHNRPSVPEGIEQEIEQETGPEIEQEEAL